ncbi:hypothetical protein EYC80_008072 [Monilinia laxa]|uniref:Uncharacterized protein n=1 Tax=Monilinia laxa TaxID=61186 RepID=A0A5N6JVJ7_MONLA|nr:hypothetical protein EYC80_008072 [Monilinia laxa]
MCKYSNSRIYLQLFIYENHLFLPNNRSIDKLITGEAKTGAEERRGEERRGEERRGEERREEKERKRQQYGV